MKNILIIFLVSLLVACRPQTSGVDTINKINDFEIEDNAKVHVAVFSDDFGKQLVKSWDDEYEQYQGLISYEVIERNQAVKSLDEISHFDLYSVNHDQVPLLHDYSMAVDDSFFDNISDQSIKHLTETINKDAITFIPIGYEGLLFAYNESLLKAYGINVDDLNLDTIPESFDSFEKIIELRDVFEGEPQYLKREIDYLFPMPINEQFAMYPFLNNGEYQFVDGAAGESLVVDTRLLDALKNLAELGKTEWSYHGDNKELHWDLESVLEKQNAPFTLVGNWMFYEQYQKAQNYNLRFSKMPTFQGKQLSPLVIVTGVVANANTEYPQAAQAVLKHMRSLAGIQSMLDADIIPVIDKTLLDESDLKLSQNQYDQIVAYSYSQIAPLQAFKQRPELRAWALYQEVDISNILSDVFVGVISPDDGYHQLLQKYSDWLDANAIKIEGVTNELEKFSKKSK